MQKFKDLLKAYGMQVLICFLAVIGGTIPGIVSPTPQPTPTQPTVPTPKPEKTEEPPQPLKAIGKIQVGSYGCTATVIGPRHQDGSYDVLTAAHCIPDGIYTGVMKLESGKQFNIHLATRNPTSDCCWMKTEPNVGTLPYALIADDLPTPGEEVWHAGYGVHQPRNREDGTVVDPSNSQGKTQYLLSVSSGDSGGGIVCNKSGRILSSVCCTTAKNVKANVWGCSVKSIRESRPTSSVNDFQWQPIEVPNVPQ